MAETMIERVKAALYLAHPWGGEDQTLADLPGDWKAVYEAMAIAAIGAMRDPSMHMIMAAHKHHEGEAWLPNSLFNSMIDAALSEGGE